MAPTPSLNVSLTPHLVRLIEALLSSGRYQSASEVVRAGLRLLEKSEAMEPRPRPVRPGDLGPTLDIQRNVSEPDGRDGLIRASSGERRRRPQVVEGRHDA